MDDIVVCVRRVADIMREMSEASQDQTVGIAQINQAMQQMDQVTQENAALVEEAAAAAQSLQSQAQALVQTVSVFHTPASSQPQYALGACTASRIGPFGARRAFLSLRLNGKHGRLRVATAAPAQHVLPPQQCAQGPWKPFQGPPSVS